jgi:hypothetical protein
MKRSAAAVVASAVAATIGCAGQAELSSSPDAGDARCNTQPMLVGVHPHAPAQRTPEGQDLVDTRGWHGRLYFGYGDLAQNTGPIVVSSLDPVTGTWIDHFTFQTEKVQRFYPIGDQLWAPAADPRGAAPDPEYAVGTADHSWGAGGIDIGRSLHIIEAVERVPGEIYLTGEDLFGTSTTITSAAVWRSVNGGPFTEIFPEISADPNIQNNQLNTWFFNAAALDGTLYVGYGWIFDGQSWIHSAVDLGEFQHPTTFAGKIVSSTLGELWAYDGAHMANLHFTLFTGTGIEQTTVAPLPIFEQTEGHLIAIDERGAVMATTDLATWSCIGQAPPDARSIGSLGGKVYVGGAQGRVYGYPGPSW